MNRQDENEEVSFHWFVVDGVKREFVVNKKRRRLDGIDYNPPPPPEPLPVQLEWVNERRDTFKVCPACDDWRMRARIVWVGWLSRGGMYEDCRRLHFDFRCLKCGYSRKETEIDPLFSEEDELERVLRELKKEQQEQHKRGFMPPTRVSRKRVEKPVITYSRCCNCERPIGARIKNMVFCEDCSIIERDPHERELFESFHHVQVDDLRDWNKKVAFLKRLDDYKKRVQSET